MTKRFARLAVAAAAVSALALPAAPASACSWTFVEDCVYYVLDQTVAAPDPICYESPTIPPICVG